MCSVEEIKQRTDEYSISNFEVDQSGQKFASLAIKVYQRSAADRIMDKPSNIRPSTVLYLCIKYLRDCIADQDMIEAFKSTYKYGNPKSGKHTFMEIYSFIRDRGRSIAQDFIILNNFTDLYYIKVHLMDFHKVFIVIRRTQQIYDFIIP